MKRRYYYYPKRVVNLSKAGLICFTSLLFWTVFYTSNNFEQVGHYIKAKLQRNKIATAALSRGPYSDALSSNFKR
jgi:hypothetical protein